MIPNILRGNLQIPLLAKRHILYLWVSNVVLFPTVLEASVLESDELRRQESKSPGEPLSKATKEEIPVILRFYQPL